LYASNLIAIWQRLVSLNTSWESEVLGKVIRKSGIFVVVVPVAGDQRVADICLTLIKSKPRFTNPSEMYSAGAKNGRCHITTCRGFWDLGKKAKYGRLFVLKLERVAENPPFIS
jgi:hypothetical protein